MSVINTNIYSLNAQKNLSRNSLGLASALERLSSGLRVNSAKDDAAGLGIGITMEKAAREISADIRNESDTISKNQIMDGAYQTVTDIGQRIAELVKQSGNYSGDTTSQALIATEIDKLTAASATVITNAKFNGAAITISGATALANLTSGGIATELGTVATNRAIYGANINTSQFKIQSFQANYENQMAARSRIMDADYATETSNLSRFQILQQAGTAMVAQANAVPQNVLSLLR